MPKLNEKIGPLPAWAWGGIAFGGTLVILLYTKSKKKKTAAVVNNGMQVPANVNSGFVSSPMSPVQAGVLPPAQSYYFNGSYPFDTGGVSPNPSDQTASSPSGTVANVLGSRTEVLRDPATMREYLFQNGTLTYIPTIPQLQAYEGEYGKGINEPGSFLAQFPGYRP